MRVSEEDMELWIGTDKRGDYPKQFVLEVLCEIANGEYEPEQLKLDFFIFILLYTCYIKLFTSRNK